MVVVAETTLVSDDVGLPSRELGGIQLDFVGEENVPLVAQGDDSSKTFRFVILLEAGG
jgi:hypothetical protein